MLNTQWATIGGSLVDYTLQAVFEEERQFDANSSEAAKLNRAVTYCISMAQVSVWLCYNDLFIKPNILGPQCCVI